MVKSHLEGVDILTTEVFAHPFFSPDVILFENLDIRKLENLKTCFEIPLVIGFTVVVTEYLTTQL